MVNTKKEAIFGSICEKLPEIQRQDLQLQQQCYAADISSKKRQETVLIGSIKHTLSCFQAKILQASGGEHATVMVGINLR